MTGSASSYSAHLSLVVNGGRRLSRNSVAASALTISTSGFGPTWRLTDGNTDDSPKDRLDLYDGKLLRTDSVLAGCPVPGRVGQGKLAALLALLTTQDV